MHSDHLTTIYPPAREPLAGSGARLVSPRPRGAPTLALARRCGSVGFLPKELRFRGIAGNEKSVSDTVADAFAQRISEGAGRAGETQKVDPVGPAARHLTDEGILMLPAAAPAPVFTAASRRVTMPDPQRAMRTGAGISGAGVAR